MRTYRIFLGSANENKKSAALLARSLEKAGFNVRKWWQGVFAAGDMTMDRLRQLATEVDGAVFLCQGIDLTSRRHLELNTPRDNVVFEAGMFFQTLGRKRCVIVSDRKTGLPSDWGGLVFIEQKPNFALTSKEVTAHFQKHFLDSANIGYEPEVHITEADPQLARITYEGYFPENWRVRALFFGTEGARNWLAVDRTEQYLSQEDRRRLRDQATRVMSKISEIDHISIATYVSLGPGSAAEDRDLVVHLDPNGTIDYIPVDISDGLLHNAIHELQGYARVPFGILCDFEDRTAFIQQRLERRGVNHPILFTLLGNTLGNVDQYEDRFMKRIEGLLRKGDYMLLEVSLRTPNWQVETDIRAQLSEHPPMMKRFYAVGLARHTNMSVETIVAQYADLIKIQKGKSDVPGAEAVNYESTTSPQRRIVSNRRYKWDKLLSWLGRLNFLVLAHEQLQLAEGKLGVGTVLIRRK